MSVLDMTLNNLMGRLQYCWNIEECRVPRLLPLLPGPLWPRVVAPEMVPIYGSNRTELCTYGKLKLFEIELFICTKNLVLNNLQ